MRCQSLARVKNVSLGRSPLRRTSVSCPSLTSPSEGGPGHRGASSFFTRCTVDLVRAHVASNGSSRAKRNGRVAQLSRRCALGTRPRARIPFRTELPLAIRAPSLESGWRIRTPRARLLRGHRASHSEARGRQFKTTLAPFLHSIHTHSLSLSLSLSLSVGLTRVAFPPRNLDVD
jgi:hypothetical protein